MILTDRLDAGERLPSLEDAVKLFGGMWGSESPSVEDPIREVKEPRSVGPSPITVADIKAAKHHWANSAPGPDGLRVAAVKRIDDTLLAVLFNVLFLRGVRLPSFTESRTILIHKNGDRMDAGNYRPITIGSALERLLHRVLAARLKGVISLNGQQRGFVDIDGTMANALVVDTFMKSSKSSCRSYTVLALDVRKAFDSVSHHAIGRALRRMGVDETTTEYINSVYKENRTRLRVGKETSAPLNIKRGVRQGDPLSPMLFNIVVDELLDELNDGNTGGIIGPGVKVAALGFADDLVLLADTPVAMRALLERAEAFFRGRGMELNPLKCASVCVERVFGQFVTRVEPIFSVGGVMVPVVDELNSFKYLGHGMSAAGIMRPNISNLTTWLERVQRAALKPDQKLSIIREFLIPKVLYGLQNPNVTAGILRDADRLIKRAVKRALHLNIHTLDAALHARLRDGGLGVLSLRTMIPQLFLRRLQNLINHTARDPVLLAALNNKVTQALVSRMERLAGDIPHHQLWRQKLAAAYTTRGLEQAEQDPASRSWIARKPSGWSGRDYVSAVQLRSNNLPVAGLPSNPVEARRCRAGCNRVESICHVLQSCPVTHWERIKRHDEVVRKVSHHCKKSWRVEDEPHVRHEDGTLFKPDIVIHLGDRGLMVLDVGVNWEGDLTLETSHNAKKQTYNHVKFHEAAARRWPNKDITYEAIVIGARGVWPRCNSSCADQLKIPPSLKASCVHSVLKWAATIHRAFGRSVWRRR